MKKVSPVAAFGLIVCFVATAGAALNECRDLHLKGSHLAKLEKQFADLGTLIYTPKIIDQDLGPLFLVEAKEFQKKVDRAFKGYLLRKGGLEKVKQQVHAKILNEEFKIEDLEAEEILAVYSQDLHQQNIAPTSIRPARRRAFFGFVTRNVGHGLFAAELISKGQFIGEYTGVFRPMERKEKVNPYLFNVNDPDGPYGRYVIDALHAGNETRFINHSKNPNCVAFFLFHVERPHIIILANQNIKAGEQLFLDYGTDYWETLGQVPGELIR